MSSPELLKQLNLFFLLPNDSGSPKGLVERFLLGQGGQCSANYASTPFRHENHSFLTLDTSCLNRG
jgi:hypothetical protein